MFFLYVDDERINNKNEMVAIILVLRSLYNCTGNPLFSCFVACEKKGEIMKTYLFSIIVLLVIIGMECKGIYKILTSNTDRF